MLEVVQAFYRAPIAEIDTDDAAGLERTLEAAETFSTREVIPRGFLRRTTHRVDGWQIDRSSARCGSRR